MTNGEWEDKVTMDPKGTLRLLSDALNNENRKIIIRPGYLWDKSEELNGIIFELLDMFEANNVRFIPEGRVIEKRKIECDNLMFEEALDVILNEKLLPTAVITVDGWEPKLELKIGSEQERRSWIPYIATNPVFADEIFRLTTKLKESVTWGVRMQVKSIFDCHYKRETPYSYLQCKYNFIGFWLKKLVDENNMERDQKGKDAKLHAFTLLRYKDVIFIGSYHLLDSDGNIINED